MFMQIFISLPVCGMTVKTSNKGLCAYALRSQVIHENEYIHKAKFW